MNNTDYDTDSTAETNTEKTIDGWLVVDWRDETHRTRKSKPTATELGANELLAKLQVSVTVPEIEVPTLAVEIDVPEPKVHAAALEALDEDDLPDWTDVADETLFANEDQFRKADSARSWEIAIDQVAMRTLQSADGRPDPDRVRKYVSERASERFGVGGHDEREDERDSGKGAEA